MATSWGYTTINGPETWASMFPAAGGARQSPIDIDTSIATNDSGLSENPLTLTWLPDKCIRIGNTGYGWKVDVDGADTELKGGPLESTYKLEQFHCHWGANSSEGSEHTVDSKAYAGELHLVHWNCDKYSSFSEAAGFDDGLAVIGIFFDIGEEEHPEVNKIVNLIPSIRFKGQTVDITDQIDPNLFLPDEMNYWTYLGSLTTPPCSESVIWIVLKKPIMLSENQIAQFRGLRNVSEEDNDESDECLLNCNYRPPLPLGSRVIRDSLSL